MHPLATRESLGEAVKAYDTVRRPIAHRVSRESEIAGMIYQGRWEGLDGAGEGEMVGLVEERMRWLDEQEGCEGVVREAVAVFEGLVGDGVDGV